MKRAPLIVAASVVLAGLVAWRSSDNSRPTGAADPVPVDIRGEPIARPKTTTEPAPGIVSHPAAAPSVSGTPATGIVPAPVPGASAEPEASSRPLERIEGYTAVGFDRLASFTFVMPEESPGTPRDAALSEDQIPASVKAFDQKAVAVRGFMLPLKVQNGAVMELLIMRDQSMCCYGTVPKITEWVSVKMTGKGVKAIMDQPVTLFGKLHVGEMRENGYLVGIYSLDGDRMAEPDNR